ncbi:MAG TPA: YggS family pyridoxal phosphate-dependent enzyme [Mucilaginibacter sp.]|nr:YggS family pyridoxal phosphate-dependent enzyme [Mucilaginibacter sp.]
MSIADNIKSLKNETDTIKVKLIVVSKTKTVDEIKEAYEAGQRLFGENMVQELVDKYEQLPKDIKWHLIGHLQSNKVKYIAPFISMVQSVDSLKLLQEIDKHAQKSNRTIDCLLQVYIADEETKYGLGFDEIIELLRSDEYASLSHVRIRGFMGIATNTDSEKQIRDEFYELKTFFDGIKQSYFRQDPAFDTLSMGMSSDYKIAIEQGSNMVRLGSTVFGQRVIKHWKNN